MDALEANPNVYFVAPYFIYSTGEIDVPHATMPDLTVLGDVDVDGEVGNSDLILIARYLVNLVDFDDNQFTAADMNEDGAVDNTDLIAVARAIVNVTL